MKTCLECATPIVGGSPIRKFCGDQCRYRHRDHTRSWEHKRKLSCADCGAGMWQSQTSLPQGQARCRPCRAKTPTPAQTPSRLLAVTACGYCGAAFNPWNAAAKYCSRPCGLRDRAGSKPCKTCGTQFRTSQKNRTFCSEGCRTGPGSGRTQYKGARWRSLVYFPECVECGTVFSSRAPHAKRCSTQCRIDASGKRVKDLYSLATTMGINGGHWYELLIAYLRERDGDHCGICLLPIDFDARSGPGGSDHGRSVDHIQPRSLGGDDDPSNLRLAHWGCNRLRSNRIERDELALFAEAC